MLIRDIFVLFDGSVYALEIRIDLEFDHLDSTESLSLSMRKRNSQQINRQYVTDKMKSDKVKVESARIQYHITCSRGRMTTTDWKVMSLYVH